MSSAALNAVPLSRRRVLASVAPLAAFASSAISAGPARAAAVQTDPVITGAPEGSSAACQRLVVPAYFNPGPEWDATIAAASKVEYVILNPNSGPDVYQDQWAIVTQAAQAAGIKVLGYVFTASGERPVEDLKQEIWAYQEWYGVDGIHLDGAQDDPEFLSYYGELAAEIRAFAPFGRPGVVWLNPGYVPDEGYMEFCDIIETYEWFYEKYPAQEFPEWLSRYPAERFCHIVYATPSDEGAVQEVLELTRRRNAGYVYITDRTVEDNEYRSLPTYWEALLDQICS